jgi:hypothetical protein
MITDSVTPNYLWDTTPKKSSEVILWHEVVVNGIRGALYGKLIQMERDWEWFFGRQDYFNCFEHICQVIDRNPERIRRGVVREFYKLSRLTKGHNYLKHRESILIKHEAIFIKYLVGNNK